MHVTLTRLRTLAAAIAVWAMAAGAFGQTGGPGRIAPGLRMEFHGDGTMSLSASGVSTRDIFLEWARQCGCYVVNADRLPGTALATPLEFTRVAEGRVLESLLRQATGFVLTPRRTGRNGASSYETIYIVPSSQASSPATASAFPAFTPPSPVPLPSLGSPDEEVPPLQPLTPATRPDSPPDVPQRPAPPPPPRTASPGVSVPMVIVPITPVPSSQPQATPGTPTPSPSPRPGG